MIGGAVIALSSCTLYEETRITQNRVQVQQEVFSDMIPLQQMNENTIAGLVKHYDRYGDGVVDLSITYDPSSRSFTAMQAGSEMARIVDRLRKNGVNNVNGAILPVQDQDEPMAVISFTSYTAHAPKGCENQMAGYHDTDIDIDPDYVLGCSIETTIARQISRPKDLLGNADSGRTTDGRRASNIVDRYRTGAPNEPLEGQSASGDD